MGEPAELSDDEREELIGWCRALIESVRNDEYEPPAPMNTNSGILIFKLAQLVAALHPTPETCPRCTANGGRCGVPDGPAMLTRCGHRECPMCFPR